MYVLRVNGVAGMYVDDAWYVMFGQAIASGQGYHLINALLLNEVQKQHRAAEAQAKLIDQQQETIDRLEARLERLEARLPADSRP